MGKLLTMVVEQTRTRQLEIMELLAKPHAPEPYPTEFYDEEPPFNHYAFLPHGPAIADDHMIVPYNDPFEGLPRIEFPPEEPEVVVVNEQSIGVQVDNAFCDVPPGGDNDPEVVHSMDRPPLMQFSVFDVKRGIYIGYKVRYGEMQWVEDAYHDLNIARKHHGRTVVATGGWVAKVRVTVIRYLGRKESFAQCRRCIATDKAYEEVDMATCNDIAATNRILTGTPDLSHIEQKLAFGNIANRHAWNETRYLRGSALIWFMRKCQVNQKFLRPPTIFQFVKYAVYRAGLQHARGAPMCLTEEDILGFTCALNDPSAPTGNTVYGFVGYLPSEVGFVADPHDNYKEKVIKNFTGARPFETISLILNWKWSLCRADRHSIESIRAAVEHRLTRTVPRADPAVLADFGRFVQRWLNANVTPFRDASELMTTEEWLADSSYTEQEKKDFRTILEDGCGRKCGPEDQWARAFIKAEGTMKYKAPRAILGRSQYYKVYFGPFVKSVENILYNSPRTAKYFAKHKTWEQLQERLNSMKGERGMESDYTSFERCFRLAFRAVCEMLLFRHMGVAIGEEYCVFLAQGEIILIFRSSRRCVRFKIESIRFSGDLHTSLGNGFSNLMMMLYFAWKYGADLDGIVEGDDGFWKITGREPTESDFLTLGFQMKLETFSHWTDASFCGKRMAGGTVILDPVKKIITLFTSDSAQAISPRNHRALLLAKCMSLYYEAPGCPITSVFAVKIGGLLATRRVKPIFGLDRFHVMDEPQQLKILDRFRQQVLPVVPHAARIAVQRFHKIDISVQHQIESLDFAALLRGETTKLMQLLEPYVPADVLHYSEMFGFFSNSPLTHAAYDMVKPKST
jgi:hypothetical protein